MGTGVVVPGEAAGHGVPDTLGSQPLIVDREQK